MEVPTSTRSHACVLNYKPKGYVSLEPKGVSGSLASSGCTLNIENQPRVNDPHAESPYAFVLSNQR
jgi:hypothetical protein